MGSRSRNRNRSRSRSRPGLARRAGKKAIHVGSRGLQGAAVGAVLGYMAHRAMIPGYAVGGGPMKPYILVGSGLGAGLGALTAIG